MSDPAGKFAVEFPAGPITETEYASTALGLSMYMARLLLPSGIRVRSYTLPIHTEISDADPMFVSFAAATESPFVGALAHVVETFEPPEQVGLV